MKINHSLGVFAPSVIRRKKNSSRRPPWYVEVPPDTVDIALLPRINRYERGGLKFRRLGSTQQKFADRLALFREAMGEIEPGLGFTEDEMRSGLEEIMRERMLMMEAAEQESSQKYEESTKNKALNEEQEAPLEVVKLSKETDEQEALEQEMLGDETMVMAEDEPLQGTPSDWLVRRLQELDRAK